MRKFRWIPLLLIALLLIGCGGKEQKAIGADDVVLTVGGEPVYAVVYRYHLNERVGIIRDYGLDDYETYLSYVSNPSINYLYAYYDTRTEEGMKALSEDVLTEVALEAAAIDAAYMVPATAGATSASAICMFFPFLFVKNGGKTQKGRTSP